ncbi:MAG: transcriptional regulator [Acidobacteriota bacterium]|nr:transcriptional regulator [Acidobacteriota bacterium]
MIPEKLAPLDPVIHSQIRLAVMSILVSASVADFNELKAATGTTDGNLSTHLAKLEEVGYIRIKKSFRGRKPATTCSLTDAGREALARYVNALESYLPKSRG